MSDPTFKLCGELCENGKACQRKEDIDIFTYSELISHELEAPSLDQDLVLGADLTKNCRRLYEIRETVQELEAAFLLGPLVERPATSS